MLEVNIKFSIFIQAQNLVLETEWDQFMEYCKKDLPSTFRVTQIRGHAQDLLKSLKDGYISKLASQKITAEAVNKEEGGESEQDLYLEPIPWYPNKFAWNSNLSRRFIRRSEVLQKLHRFLVEDSECGAISRQEAVSMIPPMLLDVKSDHLVLDMCAAPGSKTAQLIEMMHSTCTRGIPTGTILANDADHKRCYMLTHQLKRLNTPCVIVTNHDASIYPKLHNIDAEGNRQQLEFDRVLCDVPCSGDGTIRKNPLLWHKWNPNLGNALHRLQMRILIRGLELLKIGGRLVYSTCSFNPIENEAVIAAVLKEANHTVELVDCSRELSGLKRIPGKKDWSVFNRQGNVIEQFTEELAQSTNSIKESFFPPTKEIADDINLERCMRIYPHLQNTGGFFIAVLEKKDELPWQKSKKVWKSLPWDECNKKNDEKGNKQKEETEAAKTAEQLIPEEIEEEENKPESESEKSENEEPAAKQPCLDGRSDASENLKIRRGIIKEDPYIFLDDSDTDLSDIRKFYGLSAKLPSNLFLVRSIGATKKRHIYLVSEKVNQVISANKHLKVINTGVRVVTRSPFRAGKEDHGVEFRLVQDGLHLIHDYITNRIISITRSDLVHLLTKYEAKTPGFKEETQELMKESKMGCVIWRYDVSKLSDDENTLSADVWLCGHLGRNSAQVMLNKEERKHYLRLLGVPIPDDLDKELKGPSWGDQPAKENVEKSSEKFEAAEEKKVEE